MIRTYTGKPRGGKSYGALKREVLEEAVLGKRIIVTNLSINPGDFAQYVHDNYPKADFDVTKRLVLITKEEAKRFWLIRGPRPEDRVEDTTPDEQKAGKFPDFGKHAEEHNSPGVLYVIDEAHVLFDSRSWATNGLALTYYNSQHGKLQDDVVFITQFLALLDKRCTGFTQSFHVFRNFRFEKIFTYFRAPGYFEERVYSVEPKGRVEPDEKHEYRLDPKLAACYDTSAGVGISGRGQPEKPRIKGLSFWWFVGGIAAVAVSLWWVVDVPAWLVMRSGGGSAAKKALRGEVAPLPAGAHPVHAGPSTALQTQVVESVPPPPQVVMPEVWVTGYVVRGDRINVTLSNGTVLTEDGDGLERVTRSAVMVSGVRLPIRGSPGSGVKVTPVRPDTGVPGVAVPRDTGPERAVEMKSSGLTGSANEPNPPPQQQGSWVVGSDGVARLRNSESVGEAVATTRLLGR